MLEKGVFIFLFNILIFKRKLLLFSHSIMSDSLWSQGLQHTKLTYPSPSPIACSNSGPLSWWCHPTISSSIVPFSSCLQSFSASGSFLMSWLFTSKVLEFQLIKENMSILFVWFEIYFEGDNNKKTPVTTWIFGICNVNRIISFSHYLKYPQFFTIPWYLINSRQAQRAQGNSRTIQLPFM